MAATDTASYVLYNDTNNAILASAENVALTAAESNFTFAISVPAAAIAQASSSSASYKLSVTISNERTSYLASAQEVTGGFPASAGSSNPSKFVEQVSSLSVTMVNAGTSLEALPTDAAYYTVSLYEGETAEGTPLRAIDLSSPACNWVASAGTFTVSGLEVGKAYTVQAVIKPAAGAIVTLVGTVDKTAAGENSLYLKSADVTLVTVDGSDTNVSGLSSGDGSIVLSSASATATPGAVSGISGDITLTASGSGTYTVAASGTLTAPQSSESALNALTALEWTSPSGSFGGLSSLTSIKIQGEVSEGKFTINEVTVSGT